jgi:hypothetical protein
MMTEAATIMFQDADSSDEAVAIVRYDADHVALGLSLKGDGDLEVLMKKADAKKLSDALMAALTQQ